MNTTYNSVYTHDDDTFSKKTETKLIFNALLDYYDEINDIPNTHVNYVRPLSYEDGEFTTLQTYLIN
jgi:hypothetical protein